MADPAGSSTLAPPPNSSRPNSANSNRSSSSRRSRSRHPSSNGSSANSSRNASANGDKVRTSGTTTTISGGTSLGVKDPRPDPANGGRGKGKGGRNGDRRRDSAQGKRPSPVSGEAVVIPSPETSQSPPRSIHTHASPPKTALEAAAEAARKHATPGGDALSSLQKMISDLKGLPPGQTGTSPTAARSLDSRESPTGTTAARLASPVTIPGTAHKLKADAPSFTPSFAPLSPGSNMSVSPSAALPTVQRSASLGSRASAAQNAARRLSSSSTGGSPYNQIAQSPGTLYASGLPNFPLAGAYQAQLPVHQEADNEELSPLYAVDQLAQQQQLLQAQYQHQLQLLQAQILAGQIAQQQAQQQPQMGNFSAPRFQALAAQRMAAQQQQQVAAQAAALQEIYALQQEQLQEQLLQAQGRAQAQELLHNPAPVFEEDDEVDMKPPTLGPTGRPQLAPSFTFGSRRKESIDERMSLSPPPVMVNRSEGIGGAQATGLAGLAARAHKRTGSELTPAMQQQMELQKQIEALQAQQKALMHQDEQSGQGPSLSQLNTALANKSAPISRHRRVQSSLPSATVPDPLLEAELEASQPRQTIRGFGEMPPPDVPAGHNRRHSVNVFAKSAGGSGFGMGGDIPEDGVPNGMGHHRSGSRGGFESGSWRSSGNLNAGAQVTDLAAAQAQLASLAQFRAAAGGGHHAKMASFSFPNMLPNILAATTLSTPAGQSLWQQQQAFQMQLQQSTGGPQRKTLFAPHLPQASLPPLLNAGKLVVGILRVNKKNRSDAYVATDVLDADIYICGSKDRNRALEGDIVAVELLDVDEVWNTKKDKEEKKRKKEENAAYDLKPSVAKKLEKKKDDVEVEGQGLTLFDDEEVNDETKPTFAGHVVAVLFSGQLGVLRPSSAATKEKQELERREREGDRAKREEPEARPKIVWFKPTDKRVPLIAIPTEQAPPDFVENPDGYADRLFVATIKRWPITSLHPFGTLVEELGPIGNPEVETSALLKDCNFPTEEFAEQTLKCLPPLPWSIPEREIEVREDWRNERVFTVDPPNAKDLDDALSVKDNGDGTYTIGVHIADVSYFVKSNTAMDRDARKRATSVYLVQRAVPMLPPQLSEELCSLQPDVDRLAFSAIFTVDEDANVLEKSFRRTVIKSCAKLSYDDAQKVISNAPLPRAKVADAHAAKDVEQDIRRLHDLASKLRTKRIDSGAMISNNKIKVSFSLNDNGEPTDVASWRRTEANTMIEEFMLLANMSVAQVIAFGLPEQSLLRRHEPPIERRLDGFVERARKLGFAMDPTSAGTLQKSFDAVENQDEAMCLELLKRKAMQRYFCSGMLDIAKYSHWALNTPLYTHFTSPIRRYADVLVHRMLDACLTSPNPNDVKFLMDRDAVAKCAQQCNIKKQGAKLAEEQSVHLYLCMLIHDLTEKYGPVIREGRVTGVLDAAFDVVIPEFGIEKRVHVDKMPVDNAVFDEHRDQLSLYWTTQDPLTFVADQTDDAYIRKIANRAASLRSGKSSDKEAQNGGVESSQHSKSKLRVAPKVEGLRSTPAGHQIQDVRELMVVPVIVTADMSKSPPVLVVIAHNPYAK